MNSKEAFAEELQNLHVRKKSTIYIEETPNEEAIRITVDELPDQYEDMPALVPDTEDDKEEEPKKEISSLHISKENQ